MATTNSGGLQVMQKYGMDTEIGQLIASTGGKCNKPPINATADAKRHYRNKKARVRRIEHKHAQDLGITRKQWLHLRRYNVINKPIGG